MSRNFIILLVVLTAGVAGLIAFSKWRTKEEVRPMANQPPSEAPSTSSAQSATAPRNSSDPTLMSSQPILTPPATATHQARTAVAARATTSILTAMTNIVPDLPFEVKPLPVLETDYLATTNRDTRLDVMMDIAENSSAETVKALTRLFEAETDPDLKVDLLDSLLGIEGFNDEKLIMLTMGARQGLPNEVRQSAIDGLIDLDDQRVIPVLNGLLNDPDEEVRESAKDALEMIQSQPAVKLQPK